MLMKGIRHKWTSNNYTSAPRSTHEELRRNQESGITDDFIEIVNETCSFRQDLGIQSHGVIK